MGHETVERDFILVCDQIDECVIFGLFQRIYIVYSREAKQSCRSI